MIKEARFKGMNPQGKLVQGTFTVTSRKEIKEYVTKLSQRHQIRVQTVEYKKDFNYKVKMPMGKAFTGRQSAYSKDEVAQALRRMGYNEFTIVPVMLDLKLKPTSQDVMMFIKLSTNMLKDKMSFGKILSMLAEEQPNRMMREALVQIETQLKQGVEGREVFMRFTDIFGRFPAFMLGLATRSGNMTEIFEATNKFIERDMEIRKNIKKTLISPMFAIVATIGAVVYYVVDIFPATAELFIKYKMPLPPLTKATLQLSDWLGNYWYILLLAFAIPAVVLWRWWSTPKGRIWKDQHMMNLPIVGTLIHKSSIEIFFRVFGTIYSGAGDNIETIKTAAEACRNAYMEKQIKNITIPLMLKDGEGFVPAMEASGVFTKTALTRLKTGSETGNILQAAQQIATYYEAETTYKMHAMIEYIQSFVGIFIAIAITLLTVVSAEIATVSPPTN
jgi:type IV pilus assembly protein PilC